MIRAQIHCCCGCREDPDAGMTICDVLTLLSSSMIGVLQENGPVRVAENLTLIPNSYGWDQVANILYVDQPVGSGFGFA